MKKIVFLTLICCLALASCGKTVPDSSVSYASESIPGGYTHGTDWQYFQASEGLWYPKIQETEKGCFFYYDHFVYFYDAKNDVIMPLCSKNNCLHDKETNRSKRQECNAYIDSIVGDDITLMLYEDNVYACYQWHGEKTDFENPWTLIRIKADGSARDEVTFLDLIQDPLIHRGYLYYYKMQLEAPVNGRINGAVYLFCRMKLEGAHKEEVLFDPGEKGGVSQIKAYGDQIFFKQILSGDSRTFVYHIKTGTVEETEIDGTLVIYRGELYTIPYDLKKSQETLSSIRHTDVLGKNQESVIDNTAQGCLMGSDSRYLYVNNTMLNYFDPEIETCFRVYDQELKLIDEFTLPEADTPTIDLPVGGDKYQYQVFEDYETGEWGLKIWDKSSVGTLKGKAYTQKKVVGGCDPSKIRKTDDNETGPSSEDPEETETTAPGPVYSEITDTYLCEESEWTEEVTDDPEFIPEAASLDGDGSKTYYLGYWMTMADSCVTATAFCAEPGWELLIEISGYYLKDGQVYERKVSLTGAYTEEVTEISAELTLPDEGKGFIGASVFYRTYLVNPNPEIEYTMDSTAETALGRISRK